MEKNGNAVVIENSAGQSKMRNAGHMKKFVDPGTERGGTETKLPAPSIATDMLKEGVTFEQDPVGGFQQNSQPQTVPPLLSPALEQPQSRPVRKRETPKWMKDCLQIVTELFKTVYHVSIVYILFNRFETLVC